MSTIVEILEGGVRVVTVTPGVYNAQQTQAINTAIAVVQAYVDAHEADVFNPHAVTKAQVGLGAADNTSDANKPVSTAQAAADATALAAAQTYADGRYAAAIQRGNHTGTQAASTISDFASASLAVALTGLSLVTATPVTAADSILVAIGKNQAQITALDAATVKLAGSYADPTWITSLAASKLTGTTLPASIVASSLTSVGTIATGVWQGSAITDTYLGTISTAGKVSNSATTATALNTASAIVARDGSGNFTAGTITASLTGTASNASALLNATWAAPAAIGSLTPAAGTFTTLIATGNLTVDGDLLVSGDVVTVNTSTVAVEDPLVKYASANVTDAVDIGFYALYQPAATPLYTGLFRDATDGKYKLFSGLQAEPTTTVNLAGAGYAVATLVANVEGALSGNASTASALSTARAINGVNFDGTAPITVTAAAGTLSGTTLAANVVSASLNAITPAGGMFTVTGQASTTGSLFTGDEFRFTGKTRLISSVDGALALMNNAGNANADLTVGALSAKSLTTTPDANAPNSIGRHSLAYPWSIIYAGATSAGLEFRGPSYTQVMRITDTGQAVLGSLDVTGNTTFGAGGSTNTQTWVKINATDNAGQGGAFIGFRNGSPAWFIGDTAAALGAGTGLMTYVYGDNPIITYTNQAERTRVSSNGFTVAGVPFAAGGGGIERNGYAGIASLIGTPWSMASTESRFRLSRAAPDGRGATHFMIEPYEYGMAFEYAGVTEWWVQEFSIHNADSGSPAIAWVGDNSDFGGLRMTAVDVGDLYAEVASQKFTNASHGDLRFRVIDAGDEFSWGVGAPGAVTPIATLSGTGQFSVTDYLHVGGDFAIATSKFTVEAASGNTAIAGTLALSYQFSIQGGANGLGISSGTLGQPIVLYDGAFGYTAVERARTTSTGFSVTGALSTTDYVSVGVNGSASVPAILRAGQSTGIFFPATDTIALSTANAERMRLTDGGRLLLGTATDDGVNLLQVAGGVSATTAGTRQITVVHTGGDVVTLSASTVGNGGFIEALNAAQSDYELLGIFAKTFNVNIRSGVGTTANVAAFTSAGLTVTGLTTTDTLRVNVTPTAETPSATHTAVINLNGTNYKVLCLAA